MSLHDQITRLCWIVQDQRAGRTPDVDDVLRRLEQLRREADRLEREAEDLRRQIHELRRAER